MLMRLALPLFTVSLIFVSMVVWQLPVWAAIVIFVAGTLSLTLWELSKREAPELVMRQGKWYDERDEDQ